jgi:RNA 2',3'-cyclic 3'-phosphodiesterase
VKGTGNPDLDPVVRLFLSINPPPEVIAQLVTKQSSLRSRLFDRFGDELAIRWTKPSQFHITLIFLGNLFSRQTDRIRDEIRSTIAANRTLPTMELSGLGCFPRIRSPRVLWIGVKQNWQLEKLQTALMERLTPHLALSDRDLFSPHITLGRIKAKGVPRDFAEFITELSRSQSNPIASWTAKSVSLMQSMNGSDGVEYSSIAEFVPALSAGSAHGNGCD